MPSTTWGLFSLGINMLTYEMLFGHTPTGFKKHRLLTSDLTWIVVTWKVREVAYIEVPAMATRWEGHWPVLWVWSTSTLTEYIAALLVSSEDTFSSIQKGQMLFIWINLEILSIHAFELNWVGIFWFASNYKQLHGYFYKGIRKWGSAMVVVTMIHFWRLGTGWRLSDTINANFIFSVVGLIMEIGILALFCSGNLFLVRKQSNI